MLTKIDRMRAHNVLLEGCRGRILKEYQQARVRGVDDAAVLLLDPADESARAIAETSGEAATIAASLEVARRRGDRLTITAGVPRTFVVELLEEAFCDIARDVSVALEGGSYWVVVVADGSASSVMMPPIT